MFLKYLHIRVVIHVDIASRKLYENQNCHCNNYFVLAYKMWNHPTFSTKRFFLYIRWQKKMNMYHHGLEP